MFCLLQGLYRRLCPTILTQLIEINTLIQPPFRNKWPSSGNEDEVEKNKIVDLLYVAAGFTQ